MLFLPVANKSWNTRNGVLDDVGGGGWGGGGGGGVWVEWVVHPQIIFFKNGYLKNSFLYRNTEV